jgi:hypothetical protein
MTDSRTPKTCLTCFSEIDSRALVCPRCRYPQTPCRAWMKRHFLLTALFAFLLICAAFISFGFVMEFVFPSPITRQNLTPFNGQITVASSRMTFGQSLAGPVVCVVGILKNDSDVAWKGLGLEAQFYDPAGKLLDVHTDAMERYVSQLPPRGECAFMIRLQADHPDEDYASYKLFVRSAVDARSWQ